MDTALLIDAIVRQTTVLIAHLATAGNVRAPLAQVANQIFLSLVRELRQQGVGSKVIADMFGMALRTYQNRVRQLSESGTFRGRSLWEAVFEWVSQRGPVLRADVLRRFANDEATQVRAVLNDLVDGQLLSKTGRGDRTTYRVATDADRVAEDPEVARNRLSNLIWIAVYRFGPISSEKLRDLVPANEVALEASLAQLVTDGRVTRTDAATGASYSAERYLIGHDDANGWEAAVFDHYQALVTALCVKLRSGALKSSDRDRVGGSTYAFDVWPSHPHYEAVATLLSRWRREAVELRTRVESYNQITPRPAREPNQRFIAYVGQTHVDDEMGDDE